MKNKKMLTVYLVLFCFVLIAIYSINKVNSINTVDKLITRLEKAINTGNVKDIINLYPEYYHDTLSEWISQAKVDEFNSKIGDIEIQITYNNTYESISTSKAIKENINKEFGIDINIEDYQIILVSVTNDTDTIFEQTQLQVVKIKNKYYLYAEYYQGDLIQCFIE